MMKHLLRSMCVTAVFVMAPAVFAQQPPAPAEPPAAAATPAPAAQPVEAAPPPAFSYNAEGRRDPFISLIGRGGEGRSAPGSRPAGVAGLLIDEVVVRGIVRDERGFYALVTGGDQKMVYTVRPGDRLMDGTVRVVTGGEVVFSQDVNDPLLLQKQREIRKSLRPGEEIRG